MDNTEETHAERFDRWLRLAKSGDLMFVSECVCRADRTECGGHIWDYPKTGAEYWPGLIQKGTPKDG